VNGTRPARILWLDNELAIIRAGSRLLADHFTDYSVVSCFDGDATLRQIAHEPPDLLITDYHHPGASLAEMLSSIQTGPSRFPILVVSVCVGPEQLKCVAPSANLSLELIQPMLEHLIPGVLKHLAHGLGMGNRAT
jgi:CheY-like chemotaxis protein